MASGTRSGLKAFVPILVATSVLSACGKAESTVEAIPDDPTYTGTPVTVDGKQLPARVQKEGVALGFGNDFRPRFWPGVNLGATRPGSSPGELAPTHDEYRRWFREMTVLGAQVVRVYTIQKPAFYKALREHNEKYPNNPLYVIHGVWIPEEEFLAAQNAYDPTVTEAFRRELTDAVSVIHGDADLPERRGHAGGKYRDDVSKWILAWSIGVEWDPFATSATNAANAKAPIFNGKFISATAKANPMESWIASMLDHVASLEDARGWQRPLTFTNWLTADPMSHPDEPLPQEDLVSVDATHMKASDVWRAGLFASYHAYPYYPEFLRLQKSYQTYKRPQDGKIDPYAGYLHELKKYHGDQPVMITEFGMPTSLGNAHYGPLGRNQGGHSEKEAAEMVADMMSDIRAEGMIGGMVFEWIDEWFKFTWNTVDYELPSERRDYWRNPLTNEEHFGLIAAEPGKKDRVVVDGKSNEWNDNDSKRVAKNTDGLSEIRITHDSEYLDVLIKTDQPNGWRGRTLAFDVRPGGNGGLDGRPGVVPDADVQITFDDNDGAFLEQAAWTDPISWQYGVRRPYLPVNRTDLVQGSNKWVELRQIQNKPDVVPSTHEKLPVEIDSRSQLHWGIADPKAIGFDDRNVVMASDRTLEIRVPWSYLTFSDPSTHQVYVPHEDGTITSETVGAVKLAVVGADNHVTEAAPYEWDNWDVVDWHERRKAGWDQLVTAFGEASR